MNSSKLSGCVDLLDQALKQMTKKPEDPVICAAVSKAFEATFEYTWKYFKRVASKAGMEVYSPRDAVKAAAQIGLISDLEIWNEFVNVRNLSVHDYIGVCDETLLSAAKRFLIEVQTLMRCCDDLD